MELFGYELTKKNKENVSFAPKQEDDGAVVVQGGGLYGTYLDLDGSVRSESELVNKYREMAQYPEIDKAIDNIVNETITDEPESETVEIILDDLEQPDRIKKLIIEEFKHTKKLLEFNTHSYEIFKRWYIDGRLYYHSIIDQEQPKNGIQELRYIDPRKIRKVRELKKKKGSNALPDSQTNKEFYIYNEKGFSNAGKAAINPTTAAGVRIAKDSIVHCTSGLTSQNGDLVQSYLHKAIKPLNQLASMENSLIIYRVSRAPERRVFYIDVGNLPKMKAEQYLRDIMNRFKNKVVYNAQTGEVSDQRKHMCYSMDTKIPLLDGRTLELQDIIKEYKAGKKNWVYSCDPVTGKFYPGPVDWAGITKRNAKVVKITFDNGKSVKCTPDHKFPVWNKGFVEAQHLTTEDSIIPGYRRKKSIMKGKAEYEQIYKNETKTWEFTHREVESWKKELGLTEEIICGEASERDPYCKIGKIIKQDNTEDLHDHKILSIEALSDTIDVGSMTIDKNETYHSNHTYLLDAGVYTKNTMLEDFWLPRSAGGRGTEVSTLPGGCFAMNTKVSLLDGRELSIKEIEQEMERGKELWTYSCDEYTGKIKPGLISWAGVTQESAKVMKITLDNGEHFVCTPDHKFPLYDRGFVEAKDLKQNESLIPLYRKKEPVSQNKLDYEKIFDNQSKKWIATHTMVAQECKDKFTFDYIFEKDYGDRRVTHHIDFNRHNNFPNNLCRMSWKDHTHLHVNNVNILIKASSDKMKWLKDNDKNEYNKRCEVRSENSKEFWKSLTEEEYNNQCDNISKGIKVYFSTLTEEDRLARAEISANNIRNGNSIVHENRKKNPELYKERIRKGWTKEKRLLASDRSLRINKVMWSGDYGERLRANHKIKQKVDFDHSMLTRVIDLIKNKTTHQYTKRDVVDNLNKDKNILSLLRELNTNKSIPNWSIDVGFTESIVSKLVENYGYDNWTDFRKKESIHNHRIISIEYLDDPIQVGTLTIDQDEIIHNHHTFALSCGVFTKNSNLNQMEDIEYFQNKLYESLNVPITRLNPEAGFNIGRSSEISRDEVQFSKFIDRLRAKFATLFLKVLERQLILKGIITAEDWEDFKEVIRFKFATDNYFAELKETEILRERVNMLADINDFVGLYYSHEWVRRNVLKQSDEEIEEIDKQIEDENQNEKYNPKPETEPEGEQENESEEPEEKAPTVVNNFKIDGKSVEQK